MDVSPAVYDSGNGLQKAGAKLLLSQVKEFLGDRTIDFLVDLGCGPGNVTVTLKQSLNCKQIVGFDINPKMVEFATQSYANNQDIKFKECDAATSWQELSNATGLVENSTDVVFSAFAFQWIPVDQQPRAMSNLATLLKKGGRLFIVLVPWCGPFQKVLRHIGESDKWRKFLTSNPLTDCFRLVPTVDGLREEPTREEVLKCAKELVDGAGLRPVSLTCDVTTFQFRDKESFHGWSRSLCWLLPKIPEELRDEFLAEYHSTFDGLCVRDGVAAIDYQKLTIIAEKL